MKELIFKKTKKRSFRDPAAYIKDGRIYLFFTLVENLDDGQYFFVAKSESTDFENWSEPVILTEKNRYKNYSSPGSIVEYKDEYYLCVQSYPRRKGEIYGNENSRIYIMKSRDLKTWDKPLLLRVKGNIKKSMTGRMIDPFILDDGDKFICFFKQNGVSFSFSEDMRHWRFIGNAPCGENVCTIKEHDEYFIFNSPENGINILSTKDLKNFEDRGTFYLEQNRKPWACDRITAGFVLDISSLNMPYKYAMFYHGDDEKDCLFGASLAVTFGNELTKWK